MLTLPELSTTTPYIWLSPWAAKARAAGLEAPEPLPPGLPEPEPPLEDPLPPEDPVPLEDPLPEDPPGAFEPELPDPPLEEEGPEGVLLDAL